MTTVFVSGAVANKHGQGGSIWVRMSWAEGLRRLGFDVVFVEQLDRSASTATFVAVMEEFGLEDSATLIGPDGEPLLGLSRAELLARAENAELLVNISGHLRYPPLLRCFPRRAFIDLDPGFTQVWHAQGHDIGQAGHDLYFTVGENVGTNRCAGLPTEEIRWRPIRQPVVLERWPVGDGHTFSRFTTVANWRGPYGSVTWAGRTYGV